MAAEIAVPVYGQLALAIRCLTAIDRETPVGTRVLVIDDCGPERLDTDLIAAALSSGRSWALISHAANVGFVGSVNEAFDAAGAADVVVVNSDVQVLPGWFGALTEPAAGADIASVSSIADRGGLLSVPAIGRSSGSASELDAARKHVGRSAVIPVAVAHCTLFTRSAIDAVGGFDPVFSPGYGEEVDWSLRAGRRGMRHLAGLHSFVLHTESASFGTDRRLFSLQRRHEARLLARYPREWFALRSFARDRNTDLVRQLQALQSALSATAGGAASPHG